MLSKKELQDILDQALDTGADFAEIFLEDTYHGSMRVYNGEVANIGHSNVYGAGVRLIKDTDEVYGYTNEVTYKTVLDLVLNLKQSFTGNKNKVVALGDKKPYHTNVKIFHKDMSLKEKADKLVNLSNIIKNHDPRISQAITNLVEMQQDILVANTDGIYQDDKRVYTRVVLAAVASEDGKMEQGYEGPGRYMGLEIFDTLDFETMAKEVAAQALTLLHAEDMVPQVMPVVLHNGFGGVIFHEACGHPLEATAIAKGLSPFVGKIGQRVGSDKVTAYDDGNVEGAWGRVSFDDEGHPSQKNLLIENGILKGYLVDKKNGRRMKAESTGSGRRQSYKYSPTSRMNSTYIAAGTDKFEDIIKDTKYGLFAKKLGGGTVQPATGEFNFAVIEGYMIEDGKITKPVKGAMLIGHGSDVLFKIDRVADNLEFGQGMCGSLSGSIPVDVGQPTIRVSSMTVGGQGGKK